MRAACSAAISILLLASQPLLAQQPRELSPAELDRIGNSIERTKAAAARTAQQQAALRQQQDMQRMEEEALAESEADAEWEAGASQQTAAPSFADLLAHGAGVFQDEMAKKDAEQAAANARVAQIQRQAEAVEQERARQLRQRELDARLRQQQGMRPATSVQSPSASAAAAAQDRDRRMREEVAAERQRLAAQRVEAARADERTRQQAEQERIAAQTAAAERLRKDEADREQARRQAGQALRSGFSGRATTCIGGGKDVLYLQTSRPSKTGCSVGFEARCPGTPSGAGIRFSQSNYIGGSCQGIGDNIRIGTMGCAAEQVQVSMTSADCGSNG